MTTPRPDQSHLPGWPTAAGSRSGAGDTASALGYPGLPPAALNLQSAQLLRSGAGVTIFHTFTAPSRIWSASLSYSILTDAAFAGGPTFADALVSTVSASISLAVVQLGLLSPSQHAEQQSDRVLPGLAVVAGDSVQLSVSNGIPITDMFQRASALILFSTP